MSDETRRQLAEFGKRVDLEKLLRDATNAHQAAQELKIVAVEKSGAQFVAALKNLSDHNNGQ